MGCWQSGVSLPERTRNGCRRTHSMGVATRRKGYGGRASVSEKNALQLLGLEGLTDSLRIATQGGIDGAAAFLSRVCLPAAEELGFAFRDRVSVWRARNLVRMLDKANTIFLANGPGSADRVSPRLAQIAIEAASWIDDEQVQAMWSGLLASSTSPDGRSDENLIFMSLLKQLSSVEVSFLKFAVENSSKHVSRHGLVYPGPLVVAPIKKLSSLSGIEDIQRIDRELDHLSDLGLIGSPHLAGAFRGGIEMFTEQAHLTPTPLALHLYVRAQGSKLSPVNYWGLSLPEDEATAQE